MSLKVLYVLVEVSLILPSKNIVPSQPTPRDTEFAFLKVLQRNSRVVHEVPRTHIVHLITLIPFDLLGRLIEGHLTRCRVSHLYAVSYTHLTLPTSDLV